MKKIDLETAPLVCGSDYPAPFDAACQGRTRRRLARAAGLTQFGVNLQRLPPGQWSSQRHWHTHDEEFVYVLEGEVVLVTDEGEEVLRAGDCAGFAAGERNGHHFQNRSGAEAVLLEVGTDHPDEDVCSYSDIDMKVGPDPFYVRRDGTPYPPKAPG